MGENDWWDASRWKGMVVRLSDFFDPATLQRARDYARRDLVQSVDELENGVFEGRVSNGQGKVYRQSIDLENSRRKANVAGICSCPVGFNCKHVAAALLVWSERESNPHGQGKTGLPRPVQGWLNQVVEHRAVPRQTASESPDGYPDSVKDRLLYVLDPLDSGVKIDIYKGRINAA
ncbi:SWIM zinc finger domain-containing protein, partial [Aquicoccus sp.]|uniref:SWIM zinc finger family protein n=1 Tax=Aquicoccus sp. TaxID=2055851 RepID=UPI003566B3DE